LVVGLLSLGKLLGTTRFSNVEMLHHYRLSQNRMSIPIKRIPFSRLWGNHTAFL